MKDLDMPLFEVLVPITSKFYWELDPFVYLFNSFFGDSLVILGNRQPSIKNVKYVNESIGLDTEEWNGYFSAVLKAYLENDCKSEYVIVMMADYLLMDKVSTKSILSLIDYMILHDDIVRIQLSNGIADNKKLTKKLKLVDVLVDNIEIWDCSDLDNDCFLRGSLIPGIWSRKNFLRILEDGWNVWETEIKLSKNIKDKKLKSLLCEPRIMSYMHNISSRNKKIDIRNFPRDIYNDIKHFIPFDFEVMQ